MMTDSKREKLSTKTKYRWIRIILTTLTVIMLAIVTVVPGVLRLMYRADSQVALGHAKSVRMALQVVATEQYGRREVLCDASQEGGIANGLYEEIITLSKAPGDFWILQTDETGYKVISFVYTEDEFTVWYQAKPESSYKVYHENTMINTGTDEF